MVVRWSGKLLFFPIAYAAVSVIGITAYLHSKLDVDVTFGAPHLFARKTQNECKTNYPSAASTNETSSSLELSTANKYHILCTTYHTRWKWGSYQIRCRDLKGWADRCAPNVELHLHPLTKGGRMTERVGLGGIVDGEDSCQVYNASVGIKWVFDDPHPRFGKQFVDVVDDYDCKKRHVPSNIELITQNAYHATDVFPYRKYHVVEHWYNSYPDDMMSEEPVFELPTVSEADVTSNAPLKLATVWTNDHWPCPNMTEPRMDVDYQCIDENYLIGDWHWKYLNPTNNSELEEQFMTILNNTEHLGHGRLYYELFWTFDVLVIPVKRQNVPKLKYGNVQRAVSQMRSGVPVLLEVYEEVVEDFMEKYNYTCAFVDREHWDENNDPNKEKYWSFDQAVKAMISPALRRQCQEEGLRIAKDFSPSQIARKQLRALGYNGDFAC
ncbi:unnamed protein product [Cylindrotheca closterium]|uniref:Uncharacterized protein n=1 Tax=Cylindrotheca closterium TaxID=2856 RepID=A0AAD2FK58_9STRA|nr:unnamed protein product [Cylindrotheca closterium]